MDIIKYLGNLSIENKTAIDKDHCPHCDDWTTSNKAMSEQRLQRHISTAHPGHFIPKGERKSSPDKITRPSPKAFNIFLNNKEFIGGSF